MVLESNKTEKLLPQEVDKNVIIFRGEKAFSKYALLEAVKDEYEVEELEEVEGVKLKLLTFQLDLYRTISYENQKLEYFRKFLQTKYKEIIIDTYRRQYDDHHDLDVELKITNEEKKENLTERKKRALQFLQGYFFAYNLNVENIDHYKYLSILFEYNDNYVSEKQIDAFFKSGIDKYYFFVGQPNIGKTYTSYFILLKAFNKGYEIHHCRDLRVFDKLLKSNLELSRSVIYVEDPWGFQRYDSSKKKQFKDLLKEARKRKVKKLIITSRAAIYNNSGFGGSDEINRFEVFRFDLMNDTTNDQHFDHKKRLLSKTLWYYDASSQKNFKSYIDYGRLKHKWEEFIYSITSPGSIFYVFQIFPSLLNIASETGSEIKQLETYTNNFDNIRFLLSSEVVEEINSIDEKNNYLRSRLLLPAISEINKEADRILFDKPRSNAGMQRIVDFDENENNLVYFNKKFSRAVRIFMMKEKGVFSNTNGLIHFLCEKVKVNMDKINSLKEQISDVLVTYFAINNGVHKELKDIVKGLIGAIYNVDPQKSRELNLLKIILTDGQDKREGKRFLREFIGEVSRSDNNSNEVSEEVIRYFSSFGSLFERIIDIAYHKKEYDPKYKLNKNFLLQLIQRLIQINYEYDDKPEVKSYLRSSLFLHGVFSKYEYILGLISDGEEETDLLESLEEFVINIENSNYDYWKESIVVWLDAALMKMSELHLYLRQIEMPFDNYSPMEYDLEPEKINSNKALNQIKSLIHKIGNLKNKQNEKFINGGLLFTFCWHNRWVYHHIDEQTYEDLQSILKGNLKVEKQWFQEYFEGFLFNLTYHYEYFLYKAPVWNKQSKVLNSISWTPRKGADHVYESGIEPSLSDDKLAKKINLNHYFKVCYDLLIEKDDSEEQRFGFEALTFLWALRFPIIHREENLNEGEPTIDTLFSADSLQFKKEIKAAFERIEEEDFTEPKTYVTRFLKESYGLNDPEDRKTWEEPSLTKLVEQIFKRYEESNLHT